MEITGRVTQDAVVATTKSDKQVVNFNIAINDRYRTKDGETREVTEFVRCAYWIGTGVAAVLTKGTLVQLGGRMSAQAWQNADGEARASLQFHTANIKILGGGKRVQEEQPADGAAKKTKAKAPAEKETDDLPF